MLEFRILGPVEADADDRPVALPARQVRVVLAALVLAADQVVTSDRLIDMLWGERPPASARAALHNLIADLRRALGPAGPTTVATHGGGYILRSAGCRIDLRRFESLVSEGRDRLEMGDPAAAGDLLRRALGLWRGEAMADLVYEDVAADAAQRLEELRLLAVELRIDADLAVGRAAEVVAELQELVAAEPSRETLRGQLMRALHETGRQAEALDVYATWRGELADSLGLEPGARLRELHSSILRGDLDSAPRREPARSVIVAAVSVDRAIALADLGALLAARGEGPHELILVAGLEASGDAGRDTAHLARARDRLAGTCRRLSAEGGVARAAAFTSSRLGDDASRLARHHDGDLLMIAGGPDLADLLPEQPPCDVAVAITGSGEVGESILVPFGGAPHDWAALELAAWVARASGAALRLGGAAAMGAGEPDASRLLATAALIVERFAGVSAEPVLVEPGPEGMERAAAVAGSVAIGLPSGRRADPLGDPRRRVAEAAPGLALIVQAGARPGGLVPPRSLTRFSWSLAQGG